MSDVSEIQGFMIKDAKARNDIEEINKTITGANEINILIGDSYLFGVSDDGVLVKNWGNFLKNKMKWNDSNTIIGCEGGAGFCATSISTQHTNFLGLFKNIEGNISDAQKVKRIIVCGGYNDNTYSYDQICTKINEFLNYVTEKYTNAEIYIGMIGNRNGTTGDDMNIRFNLISKVLVAYKVSANNYSNKTHYLTNIECCLHDYSLFNNDKTHPNENGYKNIGNQIANIISGIPYSYSSGLISTTFPINSAIGSGNFVVNFMIEDTQLFIIPYSIGVNFVTPIADGNDYDLVDLTSMSNHRVYKPFTEFNACPTFYNCVPVTYSDNTTGYQPVIFKVSNGKLKVIFPSNNKSIKSFAGWHMNVSYVNIIDY